jgi:hypothetical protein
VIWSLAAADPGISTFAVSLDTSDACRAAV